MRKLIVGILAFIAVSLFADAPHLAAPYVEAQQVVTPVTPKVDQRKALSVEELINSASAKYNVSSSEMWRIMRCENKSFDPKMQSRHIYDFSSARRNIVEGTRERSYGLVQIHLPDHPTITYEQATDPAFSVDFLAKNLSKGRGYWWTCF